MGSGCGWSGFGKKPMEVLGRNHTASAAWLGHSPSQAVGGSSGWWQQAAVVGDPCEGYVAAADGSSGQKLQQWCFFLLGDLQKRKTLLVRPMV